MRLKLDFELKDTVLSSEYRRSIISFFKAALDSNDQQNEIERYYRKKDPVMKPFTFSMFLPGASFEQDKLILSGKGFSLFFATYDFQAGMIMYNSFLKIQNKLFPLPMGNSMILKNIYLLTEKPVNSDNIKIKMLSPLCVRQHQREDNSDIYLSFNSQHFVSTLRTIIINETRNIIMPDKLVINGFSISSVNARKTVVRHYGQMVECSIGEFVLHGHPILLNFLYQGGIGSRTSSGFGMFEIL